MGLIYQEQEVTTPMQMVVGATCDNCDAELEPLFRQVITPPIGNVNTFHDVLRVSISGGYGEYVDGHGTALLCKTCAQALEALPFLKKAFGEAWAG